MTLPHYKTACTKWKLRLINHYSPFRGAHFATFWWKRWNRWLLYRFV